MDLAAGFYGHRAIAVEFNLMEPCRTFGRSSVSGRSIGSMNLTFRPGKATPSRRSDISF
jgi:hypothetical protein